MQLRKLEEKISPIWGRHDATTVLNYSSSLGRSERLVVKRERQLPSTSCHNTSVKKELREDAELLGAGR
jgi:hypothetical protein